MRLGFTTEITEGTEVFSGGYVRGHAEGATDAKYEFGFIAENRGESSAKIPLPQWERVARSAG